MSDFSSAFAEVFRAVQPDVEPVLTCGDGDEPDDTKELDSIILASVRATVWVADAEVRYGETVIPTVGNGRKYRVTTPGTLGATEPSSWPDYDYGSVTSGTAALEEDGYFVGSVYDVRGAIRKALELKLSKAGEYTGAEENRITERLERQLKRYAPVGVA